MERLHDQGHRLGIGDPDFADKLSRLIGDHDVETTSTSHSESGKSTSVSMRQERILAADAIRALPNWGRPWRRPAR